jgi:hypothetical protein
MFRESIPKEQICRRLFQLRQSPGQALQVLTLLKNCDIMFTGSYPSENLQYNVQRVDSKGTYML